MKKFEGFLNGINLGGWISQCLAYTKEHYDSFITEEDIKRIADWKCDHVRLPLDYEIVMNNDGTFKPEGFVYIDNCISWCKKNNLNVVLDLHKTLGYMFDTDAVSDPDLFFKDEKLQDIYINLWKELAGRYGKYSDCVALELLNEIVNPELEDEWNSIATRAINEIRKITKDSWIIVGGVDYNSVSAVPGIKVPLDEKIVFTFHCYEPLVFTHQKAYWVKEMPSDFEVSYPGPSIEYLREKSSVIPQARHGAIFSECYDNLAMDEHFFETLFKPALDTAKKLNVPLYCGEYGVIDLAPAEDTANWLKDIHKVFDMYQIGHSLWNYKEKDFGIVGRHYDEVRKAVYTK